MDVWAGYVHERNALLRFMHQRRVPNPVVLTGDVHSNWVNDLRIDDRQANSPLVGTEFVGTSISSSGNGDDGAERRATLMAENPGIRFFNGQRGYVRCTVTKDQWRSDYQVVEKVTEPGMPVKTRASFVVEAGPNFRVLGKNSLDEMSLATPAVAGDSVYLRTLTQLYRIRGE